MSTSESYLELLNHKLSRLVASQTIQDYQAFVEFYSSILPPLLKAERCTVYIMELDSKEICSIFGTGLKQQTIKPPLEGSIVGRVIKTNQSLLVNDLQEQPGYHSHIEKKTGFISRNLICAPIKNITGNNVSGAVQLINKEHNLPFTEDDLKLLEEVAHYLSLSIESIVLNKEILRIAKFIGKEAERLENYSANGVSLIAESPAMRKVLDLVRMVSKTPVNVIIQGENGTGKELIAKLIHQKGERGDQPFIPVNCASIPENLMESQFFGHEKGSFTGALTSRRGLFEEASKGTLFLDEIGDMPLSLQPKVLRAIQEEEGSRVGSNKILKYELRLISATNKDLHEEVKAGRFREDLFFRLFSVEINIPPLRDRKEDILALSLHFLKLTNERFNKNVPGFTVEVQNIFENFGWPGNVRQLQKEIERLVALTDEGKLIEPMQLSRELRARHLVQKVELGERDGSSLDLPSQIKRLEIILIKKALNQSNGNKTKAAEYLSISRQGLGKKMKRYNLR